MSDKMCCWKCGAVLIDLILPMSRREECASCGADQHVCRLCRNFDPQVSDQCQEDRAPAVTDKESANFCDYFAPRPGAFKAKDSDPERAARVQLAELFGDQLPEQKEENQSSKARAQAEWEKLFGPDNQQ